MNFEQLMKLLEAGFTKDDIMKLSTASTEISTGNPTTDPEPAAPAEPSAPSEPSAPVEPAESETMKMINDLTAQVKDLTAAVQKQNIRSATGACEDPETIDDIIAGMFK